MRACQGVCRNDLPEIAVAVGGVCRYGKWGGGIPVCAANSQCMEGQCRAVATSVPCPKPNPNAIHMPCGSSRFPHAAALHQTSLALPVPELHRFTTRSLSTINQNGLLKRWRRFLHPSPYTTSTYSAPPNLHATHIRHHLCNYRSTNKIASTSTP